MAVADQATGVSQNGQRQDSKTSAAGAGSAPSGHPTPRPAEAATKRWLYADKPVEPIDPDALRFGAYADALALLMDTEDTNTPLTIAINGPWGSGKTSLAKMTEGRLAIGSDWDAPHVICWFDAWANDDAPHLGAAFAAAVAKTTNKQRHWWVRLAMPLPSAMLSPEQRWWRRLWYTVLAVLLAAVAVFWPTGGSLMKPFLHPGGAVSGLGHGTAATRLAWPVLAVTVILLAQRLAPSIHGVARWIDDPGSEAARGSMVDVNRQLGRLIKQALRGKRRLMIFVDNLERCRPPRAVEVCEVVSQLIGHPGVVSVLIGDMDTIALSAEIKYAALETISGKTGVSWSGGVANGPANGAYGLAYLEKLIQIQLRLPPPLPQNLRRMLVPKGDEQQAVPQGASKPKNGDEPQDTSELTPGYREVWQEIAAFWRLKRWPLVAGSAGVITGLTVVTAGADAVVGLGGLAGVISSALVERFIEILAERRKKQDRTVIDNAVSNVLDMTEKSLAREEEVIKELVRLVDTGEAEVSMRMRKRIVPDPDERTRWMIRRRMQQYIVSNTELRDELDHAVLEVLPLSPRGAKRMFNHAHLLLDIGVGRDLFSRTPWLRARQLAAWVALTERWPLVAAAIIGDPTLMRKLENEARRASRNFRPAPASRIAGKLKIAGLDSSLLHYLNCIESLVPVVQMLVNFIPDQLDEAEWWFG
jgi:hypothetical protein